LKYFAHVDPASGTANGDSFTLAIAHREKDQVCVDLVLAVDPPFSPSVAVEELASILRNYRLSVVVGDRFAGEFPRELFRRHGIRYDICKKDRSELYQGFLPLLNSGRVTLPASDRLVNQIVSLQRKVGRNGRESIDHPKGRHQHDDLANVVAGACELVSASAMTPVACFGTYSAAVPYWAKQGDRSKFDGAVTVTGIDGEQSKGWATSR
jgi:hypothetical protein